MLANTLNQQIVAPPTASRIGRASKFYGTSITVGDATPRKLGPGFVTRMLDSRIPDWIDAHESEASRAATGCRPSWPGGADRCRLGSPEADVPKRIAPSRGARTRPRPGAA